MSWIVAAWCLCFAFYLLFAGTISVDELATAAVLASLATVWALLTRNVARARFAASGKMLAIGACAVAGLVPAALRVFVGLLRAMATGVAPSRAAIVAFRYGVADDPGERSRRAVAVLAASLTPDRFVVRVDRDHGRVLLHEFGRPRGEPDAGWLQ